MTAPLLATTRAVTLARALAHFGRAFALAALVAQAAMAAVGLTWVLQERTPFDNFLANEGVIFGLGVAACLFLHWWCRRLLNTTASQ